MTQGVKTQKPVLGKYRLLQYFSNQKGSEILRFATNVHNRSVKR